jgi:hypothetical protein
MIPPADAVEIFCTEPPPRTFASPSNILICRDGCALADEQTFF